MKTSLLAVLVVATLAAACASNGGGGGNDPDPTPTVFVTDGFEDGDFTAAPAWTIQDNCAGGTCLAEITDEGVMTKVVHVSRSNSSSNGGLYAINLAMDEEVSGPLQLSYRTRITGLMVGGNGWDFDVKFDDIRLETL